MSKLQIQAIAPVVDMAVATPIIGMQRSISTAFEQHIAQARRTQDEVFDTLQASADRWLDRRRARAESAGALIGAMVSSSAPRELAAAWTHWCGSAFRCASDEFYDQLMTSAKTARCLIGGVSAMAAEGGDALMRSDKRPAKAEKAD